MSKSVQITRGRNALSSLRINVYWGDVMIDWYSNDDVDIYFDIIPRVGIRYPVNSDSTTDKLAKKKYPFINKRVLSVRLIDKRKDITYGFTIKRGYCFDGASIPRFFWRVIGSNTDNTFLIAALVHDILCENHNYVNYDREFSTIVFNALLEAAEVPSLRRFVMKHSVDLYQRFGCDWSK